MDRRPFYMYNFKSMIALNAMQDDEADDSDRLVIDEGDQYSSSDLISALTGKLDDMHENELPECQGCKKREAQFVCADCKRQWYCSRECQVNETNETHFQIFIESRKLRVVSNHSRVYQLLSLSFWK